MVNEYVCYPAKFASPLSSVINWLLLHVFSCQQFICRWSNLVHNHVKSWWSSLYNDMCAIICIVYL